MFEVKLYYATVINNDDQNHDDGLKKGRIQVQVLPEMKDIDDKYLPWVKPFFNSGMSASSFSYNSPEIDDKVWVLFVDHYWKNGYYLTGAFINGFFDESVITTKMNDIAETVDTTYPNLKFWLTLDQSLFFFNTDTGDKGFINQNGLYFFIDTDGKFYFYTKNQDCKIYNDNLTFDLKADGTYKIDGEGSIECVSGGQIKINGDHLTID